MMRSAKGHAVFLLAALILAALVSSAPKEDKKAQTSDVTLLDIKLGTLTQIKTTWPQGEAVFTPDPQRDGGWQVAHTLRSPGIDENLVKDGVGGAVDAGTASGDGGTVPTVVVRKRTFPTSKNVLRSIEALTPLQARRDLGVVGKDQLGKMGLAAPERTIVLQTATQTVTLQLGEKTFGGQTRYVLDDKGAVFLVKESVLAGLQGAASKMMERRLFDVATEDIASVQTSLGQRSASFEQVDREQRAKRYFAPKGQHETHSDEATNLVADIRTLRAKAYVDKETLKRASLIGKIELKLAEGAPLKGDVFERSDVTGYLVQTKGWLAELSESAGRDLVEDMTVVLR